MWLIWVYGETDKQGLLEFKSRVSENGRVVLSSWNHSNPLCNWDGLHVAANTRELLVWTSEIATGRGDITIIGNLSFLVSLGLSNNSFGGTIPQELGNLFRLKDLNMFSNFLGGTIPARLSNCSRLLRLSVDSNDLGGRYSFRTRVIDKACHLYLGRNNLKGKLPASLGNLTSLTNLFGDNNIRRRNSGYIARLTQMVILKHQNNSQVYFRRNLQFVLTRVLYMMIMVSQVV
ncbi:unnamed protein product [Microthlaspi erraticum]|uniref:Leucine-rich repeat-containing N-terminal plant-type domain-containing protein n=1 Tax=Microthlaspi erraticum TaxID=1685480 RepID=A0A6D2KUL0_9BRAS|nr:unnamed protein product [Microthlaspi erraticum]